MIGLYTMSQFPKNGIIGTSESISPSLSKDEIEKFRAELQSTRKELSNCQQNLVVLNK